MSATLLRPVSSFWGEKIADTSEAGRVIVVTSPSGIVGYAAVVLGRTEGGRYVVRNLSTDSDQFVRLGDSIEYATA